MGAVEITIDREIATIRLNRPEQRNAINQEIADALREALNRVEQDPQVRVSILSGAGHVFCAGMDLTAFADGERPGIFHPDAFAFIAGRRRSKPLIAAVQGAALAGGFELALACDLIVASEGTRFGLPEVSLGLVAAGGGTFRLARRLSPAIAMELILTGAIIDATRAEQLGLVNRVVPPEQLESQARELASRIVANAPRAVELAYGLAQAAIADQEERYWTLNNRAWAAVEGTDDAREGATAFREKRQPVWTGQ